MYMGDARVWHAEQQQHSDRSSYVTSQVDEIPSREVSLPLLCHDKKKVLTLLRSRYHGIKASKLVNLFRAESYKRFTVCYDPREMLNKQITCHSNTSYAESIEKVRVGQRELAARHK